jgi:hypothetical protein
MIARHWRYVIRQMVGAGACPACAGVKTDDMLRRIALSILGYQSGFFRCTGERYCPSGVSRSRPRIAAGGIVRQKAVRLLKRGWHGNERVGLRVELNATGDTINQRIGKHLF